MEEDTECIRGDDACNLETDERGGGEAATSSPPGWKETCTTSARGF
jgi:hypothetical protein